MKNLILLFVVFLSIATSEISHADKLSGVISWPNQEVASGITVSVLGVSVITDSSGIYSIDRLQPGKHVLTISPPGKVSVPKNVTVFGDTRINFVIDW